MHFNYKRRNVLEESARIARGNVKDISELNIENYDVISINNLI